MGLKDFGAGINVEIFGLRPGSAGGCHGIDAALGAVLTVGGGHRGGHRLGQGGNQDGCQQEKAANGRGDFLAEGMLHGEIILSE